MSSADSQGQLMPASWLLPQWPAPLGVHALCTSREGGISQGPWHSLNLGLHVGDQVQAVQSNRLRLQQCIQAQTVGARPVFLQQVHGTAVAVLQPGSPDNQAADACVSTASGVACTIMVADCLPVLLSHRSGAVVGAAHAGWRGLAGVAASGPALVQGPGVLESLFSELVRQVLPAHSTRAAPETTVPGTHMDQMASQYMAWLGPCIGPQAFEVGPEVYAAFVNQDPAAQQHFETAVGGKYRANLAQLARQRLHRLGIVDVYGNDGSADWCTVSNASRFFSHRRDTGVLGSSGRFAACIWRD